MQIWPQKMKYEFKKGVCIKGIVDYSDTYFTVVGRVLYFLIGK